MITDTFLKGYAVIKSRWITGNILDEYIPFFATIIVDEGMSSIDENLLCQKLQEKYDISLQPAVIRSVLSHAMGKGLIQKVREQFIANKERIEQFVIPSDGFEADWNAMLDLFVKYCVSIGGVPESRKKIADGVVEFINHYDDHVLYNNIGDIEIEDDHFLYCWCKFIQYAKDASPEIYAFVLGLCSANLFKNTLFYSSNNGNKKTDLVLYLDTPMVFALIGMDTEERMRSFRYIVEKAHAAKIEIKVFDHNLEEIRGIIIRAERWAHSPQYDPAKANKVAESIHDSDMDETAVTELVDGLEDELNSMGIIIDRSSYLAEENAFQLDEDFLAEAIKREYGRRALKYRTDDIYENSILVDVRSLVMIQRKRSGWYSTDFKNCRYLFVTTNNAIAKVSKDRAAEDELTRDKIPSCVTTDLLGTLLWMDFPDNSESYLSLKLIADCKSILKPTPEMIARFNLSLDEAFKRGEIEEERFLFMRSHPIVRDKLLDVTTGDYSSFTDSTWREVYSRIEASALFEGEKKYIEESQEHQKTKEMLAEATALIGKKDQTIAKKDADIARRDADLDQKDKALEKQGKDLAQKDAALVAKEEKINKQQAILTTFVAKLLTWLSFGVPYIALTLCAIFLQNNYFDSTKKGIAIGVLSLLLLALIKMMFKRIERKIKKWVSPKVQQWLS